AMSDRQRSLLRRNRIGFVFQFFNLLQTLTACENVAMPLLLGGMSRRLATKKAEDSLDRVSMLHRSSHFPEEMSGGEMQRVAVARALAPEPEAVLCDEPTGNLDSTTARDILSLLRRLPDVGRCAVVMVTHDMTAGATADRIIHIQDGLIDSEERISVRPAVA